MRATHRDASGSGAPQAGGSAASAVTVAAAPTGRRGLRYVAGLDGLRAFAVIGVLLFHSNISWMQGGFLGVDLFFVLSGFLITSLLLTEINSTGRLRFGAFYLRRARRLLPALFVTLIGTLVLALIFARDAVMQVLKDIPFALTYVTNWAYVFRQQSYFQAIGRPPLLQHLWSLAIEEQFYLIWPSVVVLLAYVFRRHLRRAVLITATVGAVISSALMAWVAARNGYPDLADPSPIYFATHTHAMGILTGAALAALFFGRFSKGPVRRSVALAATAATVVGVAGVVASYVLISEYSGSLYRGGMLVFALVCAVAVAGVAVPGSLGSSLLGTQPLRYIGQRSYGLYLYHWPIFMLLRPGQDVSLTGWPNIALTLVLTFGVAELSYRYVEMPVRSGAFEAWLRGGTSPAVHSRVPRLVGAVGLVLAASMVLAIAARPPASTAAASGQTPRTANTPPTGPTALPTTTPTTPPKKPAVVPAMPGHVPVVRTATTFVGDSVMLGAKYGLRTEFTRVRLNAVVGRQPREFPKIVKQLKASGHMTSLVVIHMGTNGYVSAPILRHVLGQLRHAHRVILVTVHVPRPWTNGSNIMIDKLGPRYPNVRIADWARVSAGHSNWFVKDGAHLTPKGAEAYAQLIARTIES